MRWEILVSGAGDVGEQIYKLATEKGWTLTELTRRQADLEDTFLKITDRGTLEDA
jgi:hypothetical protein